MITMFFTARKLIVLDVIPKGWKYNQLSFVDDKVRGLKRGKMSFGRHKPGSTFCVHMDNSMCHHRAHITSEFQKHHLARMPHPPYSPDISPCDFWLLGMVKGIRNDREFVSSEEIEVGIAEVWNSLTSDDV
jgi:hypothetical protein